MAMQAGSASLRSLHWVLKVGNLRKSLHFLQGVLGLRVLRHEEFSEGCEATCNGPYGGAWSKTMVGFGPERNHFALELTYNYGIEEYEFGNDLQHIALYHDCALERAKAFGYTVENNLITGPDNYKYLILPPEAGREEQFAFVSLRVNDLSRSVSYWKDLLGLRDFTQNFPSNKENSVAFLGFHQNQTLLQLQCLHDGEKVNHSLSGGRIAFACKSVPEIFDKVKAAGEVVQTPPLTLPTPGKADVVVTILLDPDEYEICFVEDVGFYDLATPTYDVVDFEERAQRGGDGVPLKRGRETSSEDNANESLDVNQVAILEDEDKLPAILESANSVILEFSASWCKNCKKASPLMKQLVSGQPTGGKGVLVVDVDIDDCPEVAEEYGVSSIPRFIAISNKKKVDDYTGSNAEELTSFFKKHATN